MLDSRYIIEKQMQQMGTCASQRESLLVDITRSFAVISPLHEEFDENPLLASNASSWEELLGQAHTTRDNLYELFEQLSQGI